MFWLKKESLMDVLRVADEYPAFSRVGLEVTCFVNFINSALQAVELKLVNRTTRTAHSDVFNIVLGNCAPHR